MDVINLTVPNVYLCFLILSRDHIKKNRFNLYIRCLILCVAPQTIIDDLESQAFIGINNK